MTWPCARQKKGTTACRTHAGLISLSTRPGDNNDEILRRSSPHRPVSTLLSSGLGQPARTWPSETTPGFLELYLIWAVERIFIIVFPVASLVGGEGKLLTENVQRITHLKTVYDRQRHLVSLWQRRGFLSNCRFFFRQNCNFNRYHQSRSKIYTSGLQAEAQR